MRVTVFGASGRLGRELVPQLAAAGHEVVGVVRRPEQLAAVGALGGVGVLGDVEGGEHGDLGPALVGADAVVWAAGASRIDAPGHSARIRDGGLRAIAAGADAGVGWWIQVSSLYANRVEDSPEVMHDSLRNKYVMDEALERSGMPWTVVRPGGLSEEPAIGTVAIAPELPAAMVTRADVAAVVVELLRTGAGAGAQFDLVNDDSTPVAVAVAAL